MTDLDHFLRDGTGRLTHWILGGEDGHQLVEPGSYAEYVEWMNANKYEWTGAPAEAPFVVGKSKSPGIEVSTVFLGLDHAFGGGPPLVFETLVFASDERDGEMDRYPTWADAAAGHRAMCERMGVTT